MNVYYFTPLGKKLKSIIEVGIFLQQNPEFSEIKASEFSFTWPKIMDDTIPSTVLLAKSNKKGITSRTK